MKFISNLLTCGHYFSSSFNVLLGTTWGVNFANLKRIQILVLHVFVLWNQFQIWTQVFYRRFSEANCDEISVYDFDLKPKDYLKQLKPHVPLSLPKTLLAKLTTYSRRFV